MKEKSSERKIVRKALINSSALSRIKWLKNLSLIKAELKSESFPKSSQEGFRIGIALMAQGWKSIRDNIKSGISYPDEQDLKKEIKKILTKFSMLDARLIENWKNERKRFIGK